MSAPMYCVICGVDCRIFGYHYGACDRCTKRLVRHAQKLVDQQTHGRGCTCPLTVVDETCDDCQERHCPAAPCDEVAS